jgi:prepilin peptidase CpaA
MFETALILFFPFLMAYAAASDLVSMTISNRISLVLMAGFVLFAWLIGMNLTDFAWHWAMFALVLFGGFALFAAGVIGGGDAKLAACAGLWLGWENALSYFTLSAVIGGVLTILIIKMRATPLPDRVQRIGWVARLYRADEGIPYGIALGFAAILVYPNTVWMEHVFELAHRM